MAAQSACTGPSIVCQLAALAEWLFARPDILAVCLLAAVVIILGIDRVINHARRHGFRATLAAAWHVVPQVGYYAFAILKWLSMGKVAGVIAAVITLLVGFGHFWPGGHHHTGGAQTEQASASTAGSEAPASEATTQTAAAETATTTEASTAAADAPEAAQAHRTSSMAEAAECAVRMARQFPDRKVEVRVGDIEIVVHPRDDRESIHPA